MSVSKYTFYFNSDTDDSVDDVNIGSNKELLHMSSHTIRTPNYNIYLFNDGKVFIDNIITWTYNNPLDATHVKTIKEQLINDPVLTGVFTAIKLRNGKVYLLDGHHRHQALVELYSEGLLDDELHLEVHCYDSDTINSASTMNLFKKLNNTKPFSVDIRIQELTLRIIDFMEQTYTKCIKDITRKSYPYIRKKELNDALQTRIRETKNFDYDTIVRNISRENGEYQSRARQIYRENNTSKTWENVKLKVNSTGCYLGLGDVRTWVNRVIRII